MKFSMLLFLFWIHAGLVHAAGNGVNNGGNAVLCASSTKNAFTGYYSLDFLIQYRPELLPVPVASLNASLDRIEMGLRNRIPELLTSFRDFRAGLFNEDNPKLSRLWEKVSFGLVDLDDQDVVAVLPENCRTDEKISVVPAVIRQSPGVSGRPPGTYIYRYVPQVIEALQSTNPIQLSFLILHEWLWDFSSNVDRNRRIDYWLHSENLENWNREEWIANLHGIGFSIPKIVDPVFDKAFCPAHGESLKNLFSKIKSHGGLLFGYGESRQRTRLCLKNLGCEFNGKDDSSLFAQNFRTHIFAEVRDGHLLVRSRENGELAVTHVSCELDFYNRQIKACTNFSTASGYAYSPQLRFTPTVGQGCVRFDAQAADSTLPGMAKDFVLFFKVDLNVDWRLRS